MAYTALDAVFTYKLLLTHQRMDQLGENDKVFNDLLTAVTDFDNNLRFNNAKYLQGEIAAGSTYKKLIGLDASNHVQLGESGTEVRVPADPTNSLGVATKAYVDGVQMFQTQPIVSVTSGGFPTLVTILSLSATTRAIVHSIRSVAASAGALLTLKITVDGTVVVNDTGPAIASGDMCVLGPGGKLFDTNLVDNLDDARLVDIRCNSTLLIEAYWNGTTSPVEVLYSKIP